MNHMPTPSETSLETSQDQAACIQELQAQLADKTRAWEQERASHRLQVSSVEITLAEQTKHIDELAGMVDQMVKRVSELQGLLLDSGRQLNVRDAEIQRLRGREAQLEGEIGFLRSEIRAMTGSKFWRLRNIYRGALGRVRSFLHRR